MICKNIHGGEINISLHGRLHGKWLGVHKHKSPKTIEKEKIGISIKGKAYWQNDREGQNTERGWRLAAGKREQIGSSSDANATFQFEYILFMVMR